MVMVRSGRLYHRQGCHEQSFHSEGGYLQTLAALFRVDLIPLHYRRVYR